MSTLIKVIFWYSLTGGCVWLAIFWWRYRYSSENRWKEPWKKYQQTGTMSVTRPDNPRFKTWDDAMNRPIGDDERFSIEYADYNGEITERIITPKMIHLMGGRSEIYISALCHLRNEERTFRSDKILSSRNLKTNRIISDLGAYLRKKY